MLVRFPNFFCPGQRYGTDFFPMKLERSEFREGMVDIFLLLQQRFYAFNDGQFLFQIPFFLELDISKQVCSKYFITCIEFLKCFLLRICRGFLRYFCRFFLRCFCRGFSRCFYRGFCRGFCRCFCRSFCRSFFRCFFFFF